MRYPYGITLWDWIKLLVVPAVIAGGGLWFNTQQRAREEDKEGFASVQLETLLTRMFLTVDT